MKRSSRTASALAFSALVVIVVLYFPGLLRGDQVPLFRDLLFFVLPFKNFLAEHLRRGEIPLWNPFVYMGTPFLASLQTGVFYPPSVLLLLPFPLGLNIFLLAHYLIALAGTYLFLRERGRSIAAAGIGSLTFALGGYLVSMLSLTNHLQAAVWAPWVLFWWERTAKKNGSLVAVVGLALLVSIQLLGGSPENLAMTIAVLAAYASYQGAEDQTKVLIFGARLVATLLLVAALTAFQILPTVEYIGESIRQQNLSIGEVTAWSLQPVSVLQLLIPHSVSLIGEAQKNTVGPLFESFVPWIPSIYLGLAPLCLAIAGLGCARDRRLWGIMIVVASLLALGDHTPVFSLLYRAAPSIVGKFRFPEKFFFVIHFGAAVLAAEGAERILSKDRAAERLALVAAATFMSLAGFVCLARWLTPGFFLQGIAFMAGQFASLSSFVDLGIDVHFKAQRMLIVLGSFAGILLLGRREVLRTSLMAALLVGVTAADLGSVHLNFNMSVPWSELERENLAIDPAQISDLRIFHYQTVQEDPPISDPPPVRGLARWRVTLDAKDDIRAAYVQFWRVFQVNIGMMYGVENIAGFDGMIRKSDDLLRQILTIVPRDRAVKLLAIYSVGYLSGPVPLDLPSLEQQKMAGTSPYFLYRIREPLPRAYFVSRLRRATGDTDVFNEIIDPTFQPGRDAVVDEFPAGWANSTDGRAGAEEISTLVREHERSVMSLHTDRAAFLVINQSYFPGWEASLDDVRIPIQRANGVVSGIAVPAGTHTLELVYRPRCFYVGSIISAASLLLTAAITVWASRPDRRAVMTGLELAGASTPVRESGHV